MRKLHTSTTFYLVGALKIICLFLVLSSHPSGYTADIVDTADTAEVTDPPIDLLRYVCEEREDLLAQIHEMLLKVLLHREMLQDHDSVYTVPSVGSASLLQGDNYLAFLDLIISEAKAARRKLYCNYGGWPSLINNRSGKCMTPWNKKVRSNKYIKSIGGEYSGKFTCRKNNMFRCNPILFGIKKPASITYSYPNPNRGICVKVPEEYPQMVMKVCMKAHAPNKDRHIRNLRKNRKLLAHYLGIVSETIRYCVKTRSKYCSEFIQTAKSVAESSLCCFPERELLPYLPVVQTPDNFKVMDKITNGLLTRYAKELRKVERKKVKKSKGLKGYYQEQFAKYSNDPKTKRLISRIKANSRKCLKDSCARRLGRRATKKAAGMSTRYCYRYVKQSVLEAGYVRSYPRGLYASRAGKDFLEKAGFVNLRNIRQFRRLRPEHAPKGAIIVYAKTNSRDGTPGHTEVKLESGSRSEFGSDFLAAGPISNRLRTRRVIGIYVKIKRP